jgi:hypothetical protein
MARSTPLSHPRTFSSPHWYWWIVKESQVPRMTIVSAVLLKELRYLRLNEKLTETQLTAQSSIHVIPALKTVNLGDLLHNTKSSREK